MNKFALLAALAAAPLLVNPGVALAETKAAAVAPAAAMESVGVVPAKIVPAVEAKVKAAGRTLELQSFTQALENRLTESLTSTRKFKVVTRGDLDEVLKEQNLAASGNLNADDPQLAQRFKLAGVKSILLVTVDDFQDREEEFRSEALGQTIRRRTIRVAAAAKLIDTTTGQVRESVSIPAVTQDDVRGMLAKLRTTADRADAIAPELARLVSARISQRLVDARFPAKVLAKSPDGIVTFNRGDGSGVQTGQEWGVYAVGEAMVDPDTGESLGAEEVLIGRAIVTEVEAKFAKARLLQDQGVERGAVLRPVSHAAEPAEKPEPPRHEPTPVAPRPEAKPAAESTKPVVAPAFAATSPTKLTLDKDRTLRLDGAVVSPADAPTAFAKLAGTRVLVSADSAVPEESVKRVLDALAKAGVTDVTVSKE
jgi:curli biogenesis system outer membrane secretion channel CsgG